MKPCDIKTCHSIEKDNNLYPLRLKAIFVSFDNKNNIITADKKENLNANISNSFLSINICQSVTIFVREKRLMGLLTATKTN